MSRAIAALALAWLLVAQPAGAQAAPRALHLVSWNLEWLADAEALQAAGYWSSCSDHPPRHELPPCDAYAVRGIADGASYTRRKLGALRATFAQLAAQQHADVIAVQEVQNARALQAVLPPGYHVACMTTRPDAQNLGYALRDGNSLQAECSEVMGPSLEDEADVAHPLRRGLELRLALGPHRLALLNLHLKAGCARGRMDAPERPDCALLQRQVPRLEHWAEQQALPFMILGDWNRDLDAELRGRYPARTDGSDPAGPLASPALLRNLWPELDDGQPPASAMALAAVERAGTQSCRQGLDQIALSVPLLQQLDPRSLDAHGRLKGRLLTRPDDASDHCPLLATLQWPEGIRP